MEKEIKEDKLGDQAHGGLGKYDDKGNSAHYQSQFMEFVRMQERTLGTIGAYIVCVTNVDKYSQRAGLKAGVLSDADLTKRNWYLKAAKHFKAKIDAYKKGVSLLPGRNAYVSMCEEFKDLLRAELSIEGENYVPLAKAIEQ
jgi:hypothetical protein